MAMLVRFAAMRPQFEVPQQQILDWLAIAHAEAEAANTGLDDVERARFRDKIARVIAKVACDASRIASRGQSVADIESAPWTEDALYDIPRHPHGKGTAARTKIFADVVDAYFQRAYADEREAPDDLVHVTCTGYVSPSGAQKLVAARRWPTRVTNAWHMGCYAAIPALRIASGFLASVARRVDVVHTELCSLHLDPSDHALEQLVVQSLFADGFIRYRVVADHDGPGLVLRAIEERIIPDTAHAMTWVLGDHGMQMTLAREVPDRIAAGVRAFVTDMLARAGFGIERLRDAVVAIHPGGPKIIDRVRDALELAEPQVEASRGVLRDFGNMSSATLPHIWMRVLADPRVPRGTLIPSLAFGPGLTMCGAILEKR